MSPIGSFKRLAPIEKGIVKLGVIAVGALVVIVGLLIAVIALSTAKDAKAYAQADCGSWHDIAVIPPSPTAPESGLRLYAGFRNTYVNKGCIELKGPLLPPDPRLLPFLDARAK